MAPPRPPEYHQSNEVLMCHRPQKSFQTHGLTCSLSNHKNQGFVVAPVGQPALASTTALDASRINAKQEKRKRNRENMRKFKKGGRKGTSKKKLMRKAASGAQRQVSDVWVHLLSACYLN